jgi:hypothetical protein
MASAVGGNFEVFLDLFFAIIKRHGQNYAGKLVLAKDSDSYSLLTYGIANCHTDFVKKFLIHTKKYPLGYKDLSLAQKRGCQEIVEALRAHE